MEISLKTEGYLHVFFKEIPKTIYQEKRKILEISVDKSSSALIKAFSDIKKIDTISFQWRKSGELKIIDSKHEQSKRGDDAYLRVGLIISGEAPFIPNFVSPWINKVSDYLKLPSDRMIHLIPGSINHPGTSWGNPYVKNIKSISVAGKLTKDGWEKVSYSFAESKDIVGIWLQSDGDDTKSKFKSYLKDLTIK